MPCALSAWTYSLLVAVEMLMQSSMAVKLCGQVQLLSNVIKHPAHSALVPLLWQAANEIAADSIVMDCEDGVAANMKEMARETIALMLDGERQ